MARAKLTTNEREVSSLTTSYGKNIEFIAVAKSNEAAKRFAKTLNHLQRAGASNIKVSSTDKEVYFSSTFRARGKTKVCYFITKHANEQGIVIPHWVRSHGSFYKCRCKPNTSVKRKTYVKKEVPTTSTSVKELKQKLANQTNKYVRRPKTQVVVAETAPKKVSLLSRLFGWLTK